MPILHHPTIFLKVNVKLYNCPQNFVGPPEFCMMAGPGDSAEAARLARAVMLVRLVRTVRKHKRIR